MNPSKFYYFSQFLFILFYIFHRNNVFAADTWPCLQIPGGNPPMQCHDGKPCNPSTTSQSGFACSPPLCSSRADCEPFDCDTTATPTKCQDFIEKKIDASCTTHIECGPDKLCNDMLKCMPTTGSPFFGSSFLRCDVGAKPPVVCTVPTEDCAQNPGGTSTQGVCLKKTNNVQILKDLLTGTTKSPIGVTPIPDGGGEGQPCTYTKTKCATPFFCDSDGICKKTNKLKGEITGHRIPPPPEYKNCRDALDSGETDENKSKCKERKELCTQPLYIELMKEQCPKTCGYCEDPNLDLAEYVAESAERGVGGVQRTGGAAVKTVKVDPSAACSDRKLPDKQSDCPNLKQLCNDPTYKSLMQEECPKTCGFCT